MHTSKDPTRGSWPYYLEQGHYDDDDDDDDDDKSDKGHEGSNSLIHPSHGTALLILLISAPAALDLPAAVALLAPELASISCPPPRLTCAPVGGPLGADPALVCQNFLKAELCLLQPQLFRVKNGLHAPSPRSQVPSFRLSHRSRWSQDNFHHP